MKQFLKFFFASFLGTIASLITLFFLFFIIMLGIVSMVSTDETVSISPNTILKLEFDKQVPERTQFDNLNLSSFLAIKISKNIGLNDIVENINKAKNDSNIIAIYMKMDDFNAGSYATIEPIRNALIDFKESKKPIIAHGNYFSQTAYYLASVADSVYLTPTGGLDFRGLNTQLAFFKKTLDKLEIEAQVIKVGKFKSAVEPFLLEGMSEANREQLNAFVNSINNYLLNKISIARKIEASEIQNISNNMLVQSPKDAVDYNLVDKLNYEVDVLEILKNISMKKHIKTISLKKYVKVEKPNDAYTSNRIAVIYAIGEINGGEGSETVIGKDNIVDAIRKARKQDNVKAIVMRVNSPGGSALISDLIWKEVELAKAEKPFVVSYGRYAASGGYYISCGADKIIAEPTTLTGSIGVFSIIPNMQKFFDSKLGITFDGVKSGKFSDFASGLRPLNMDEKNILQKQVDFVYSTFVNNVAIGRQMSFDEVNNIGQGRIWSGLQAIDLGLVDEIGGLKYAIESAKELAKIDDYKIIEYPAIKEPFQELIETLQEDMSAMLFSDELDNLFSHYSKALNMVKSKEVQARLPFEIEIN
ncbi:MAG: signal peptide peptidase SppA [Bacteroidetes bacterium]|nr:signal peptide peptidase SppA [Bacteroidota bacterium]MBU1116741.1 signal peptide peptidase SppA [Bacteroidota bacterium]MBU1798140.1 signal peptide peptidase SppA [Bacteroidota bacterium]